MPMTRLLSAVYNNKIDLVKKYLDEGDDINALGNIPTQPPEPCIAYAFSRAQVEVLKLLITRGADITYSDDAGNTALHFAARIADVELVKLILSHKDCKKIINNETGALNTPLHYALGEVSVDLDDDEKAAHLEVTKLLLDNGADVNADNRRCRRPLEMARELGDDFVALIKQYSPDTRPHLFFQFAEAIGATVSQEGTHAIARRTKG